MLRIILVLAALLAGCNSTESDSESPLSAGTYEMKMIGADGTGTVQFRFNADGTYTGKGYLSLVDGSMDCLISEGAGSYQASATNIKMTNRKRRARVACADSLGAWESSPDSNEEIRNVTPTSFEMYSAASEDYPAQWVKYKKL